MQAWNGGRRRLMVSAFRSTVYSFPLNCILGTGIALDSGEMGAALQLEARAPTPKNGFVLSWKKYASLREAAGLNDCESNGSRSWHTLAL